jgi:hypothetical protein
VVDAFCTAGSMSIRYLLAIALPLIVYCDAAAPAAAAQTSLEPAKTAHAAAEPAKTATAAPNRPMPDQTVMHPMDFFHAHGEANACGLGCSEWIAAEGKIDNGTADRLQRLLAQLHGAPLPIYFHSPGGAVNGSMELGRLIRAHKMTVSVGRTIPLSCERGAKGEKSCETQIGAGRQIEAKLGPLSVSMCNSACVHALAGGVVRLIPPGVTLGIHDIGFDPAFAKNRRPTAQAIALAKAVTDARLHKYIRFTGIDGGLLTEAAATPFTSVGRLTRDDAARFGLDRREFGETLWQFADKPLPAITKTFFVRTDNSERHYVTAVVSVSCTPWHNVGAILLFARERLGSDTETVAGEPPVSISVNGRDIRLARATSDKFYQRGSQLPFKTLEAAPDDATIVLPGPELGRQQGPSGDVTLAMAGFSPAYAKLESTCAQEAQQAQAAQVHGGIPPLHPTPVGAGASRGAVDATLGAPTQMVGSTALYSYKSAAGESKIMTGYFDGSGHLQRFARYVLKDGKVFDEISETELSEGQELLPLSHLLAIPNGQDPNSLTVLTPPPALPGPQ